MSALSPSENPPATVFGGVGVIGALIALADGWPWYGALLLVIVGLASGLVAQRFTKPKKEQP